MSEGSRDAIVQVITAKELHTLYEYWKSRCRGDQLPSPQQVDPIDLPRIVGLLLTLDVHRDPLRFLYRYVGPTLITRTGLDLVGTFVDEHPEMAFRHMATGLLTDLVSRARPYAVARDMQIDGRVRRYDMLALPLATDGTTVDRIIIGMKHWE
jgi:hypothetical protein